MVGLVRHRATSSFNNAMSKQVTTGAAYTAYYADRHTAYQFGWTGTAWHHLDAPAPRSPTGGKRAAR